MTFKREQITTQAGVTLSGYRLAGSPWIVAKIPNSWRGGAWAVIHAPTALPIRRGMESMKSAKSLAEYVHAECPELPALDALPIGRAPARTSEPEAFAEARTVAEAIRAYVRREAVAA